MQRQQISESEIPMIIKKFNKSLWLSLLVFPFVLLIILLPIYLLIFFVTLFLFKQPMDSLLTIYVTSILGLVILNFLYGKIVVIHKIKNKGICRIKEDFTIQRKDTHTYTSDTMSNSDEYKVYLIGENHEQKRVSLSKEDYRKMEVGKILTLVYYEWVNIPIEGFYENERLEFFHLFSVGKLKSIRKKIFFGI